MGDEDAVPWSRIRRWPTSRALMTAAALGTGLLVLMVAVVVEWPRLGDLDTTFGQGFHDVTDAARWLLGPARLLSVVGTAPAVVAVCLVVAADQWRRGRAALGGWLLGTVAGGWLLTQGLKLMVDRDRPPSNGVHWVATDPSWPSGHASAGVYAYGGLALLAWWTLRGRARGWVTAVLAVLGACIGLSRLVLLVHWPSDVVAGWAVGLLTLLVSGSLLAAWTRRHPQPAPAAADGVVRDGGAPAPDG